MTRTAKPQCSTCKLWTRRNDRPELGDCAVLEKPSPETANCKFHEEPPRPGAPEEAGEPT